MEYAIGIDIGGTKIASGIVNEKGDVIQQEKVPSDPSDREKMFEQVVTCVNELLGHSSIPFDKIVGIGAGVPGKIDVDKGIAVFQNNLPWGGFPLKKRLQEAFGIDQVTIDNDVYMATFAEWNKANMKNNEVFVYMTISTGISCAIIQGGEFLRGAGFAGEVGLLPVVQNNRTLDDGTRSTQAYASASNDGDGVYESNGQARTDAASLDVNASPLDDLTYAGNVTVGRLETFGAGPALEKSANERYGTTDLTGEEIFARFYDGDETAKELVLQMADAIAQVVYMITSIVDPHKITFGGSVASHNPHLVDLIKEKLSTRLLEEQKHILDHMDVSTMDNGQGIIGAGLHVLADKEQ